MARLEPRDAEISRPRWCHRTSIPYRNCIGAVHGNCAVPQLVIQAINNGTQWSEVAILSCVFGSMMVVNHSWKYAYFLVYKRSAIYEIPIDKRALPELKSRQESYASRKSSAPTPKEPVPLVDVTGSSQSKFESPRSRASSMTSAPTQASLPMHARSTSDGASDTGPATVKSLNSVSSKGAPPPLPPRPSLTPRPDRRSGAGFDWMKYQDPDRQLPYFHNSATGETRWELPEGQPEIIARGSVNQPPPPSEPPS